MRLFRHALPGGMQEAVPGATSSMWRWFNPERCEPISNLNDAGFNLLDQVYDANQAVVLRCKFKRKFRKDCEHKMEELVRAMYWIFTALLIAVPYLVWLNRLKKRRIVQMREAAKQDLLTHQLHSSDPRFCFDPNRAVLVFEQEMIKEGDPSDALVQFEVHNIYRNDAGEYFLFIAGLDSKGGYLTHLSRERAMNAIRVCPKAFKREFPDV